MRRLVIVGAGLAGLTAARCLTGHYAVVVLDKSRGVGGRMATRRIGAATVDHGAQFFTTHTAEFAAVVDGWAAAGVAQPWFAGRVGPRGIIDADGHTRFRGVGSMNALAQHLAEDLDVRRSTPVQSVTRDGEGWLVTAPHGALTADAVVLTAPVPQSLALLAAGDVELADDDRRALQAIEYEPCLAVLAALDGPTQLPIPGAIDPTDGPVDWVADNHRKGVSATPAVTIHATATFSRQHWDADDETVIDALMSAVRLGCAPLPGGVQVQRWRFARPITVHPTRFLAAKGLPNLLFAGDAFGGAKVEGAVLSGRAAAEWLLDRAGQTPEQTRPC
ncbi:MAG: FAD-dependent oxidoreductase [Ilumatobacteraceae bacterium]